jgi:hypothetical protein
MNSADAVRSLVRSVIEAEDDSKSDHQIAIVIKR